MKSKLRNKYKTVFPFPSIGATSMENLAYIITSSSFFYWAKRSVN